MKNILGIIAIVLLVGFGVYLMGPPQQPPPKSLEPIATYDSFYLSAVVKASRLKDHAEDPPSPEYKLHADLEMRVAQNGKQRIYVQRIRFPKGGSLAMSRTCLPLDSNGTPSALIEDEKGKIWQIELVKSNSQPLVLDPNTVEPDDEPQP